MAIKTERTAPTVLKIYDDDFGDDKMYLTVSQTSPGSWTVRIHYTSASEPLERYGSAQDAVDAAVKYLKDASDELDAAANSIP